MSETLYVIDSFSLAYRGHFALLRSPTMTSNGINTSAVLVFANVLFGILERHKPSYLIAVFDESGPTFRHARYPAYKAGREAMPEDLSMAISFIRRLLDALSIPAVSLAGWEADDLAATLAVRAEAADLETFIVTSDKDYEQLATAHTRICKPSGRGEKYDILGEAEVCEKWSIERVEQVVDILALMGDKADNVPGIPGIGEKTAQKLIAQYGTVESLLEHSGELKGKQGERVREHATDALLSKELVLLHRDAPIEVDWQAYRMRVSDTAKLSALLAELELDVLAKRVLGEDATSPEAELRTILETPHVYTCIDTIDGLLVLRETLSSQHIVALDLETTGLDVKTCEMLGVALSFEPGSGFYIDIGSVGEEAVLEAVGSLLNRSDLELVGHNLKFDLGVLRWRGVKTSCSLFDTMLAAFVCMPEQRRRLDDLAGVLLEYKPISYEELAGPKGDNQLSLRDVALDAVVEYAVEDADIALQLANVLRQRVCDHKLEAVLYQVECPLIPVLVEMEYEGIRLDRDLLNALSDHLVDEINAARASVYELAGHEVDMNSARQVGEVLFDELHLDPQARRTAKTGQYQTSEAVLRRLESRHPIVERILHYRMCTKLKSVYLSQLPSHIYEGTGRVHTQYESASIVTGRMQSHGPNLQTIPVRTEMGRRIRAAFVARDKDHVLLAADYSQIELRIAAELSKDKTLNEVFAQDGDIHAATAAKIHGVEQQAVTNDMRQQAKTVNFGILYGISAFGLSQRLNLPRSTAAELISQYFSEFPGIADYIEETLAFAREHEYVTTLLGRRRYVRNINSRNRTSRQADERNAINSRIQGTGADMIKVAMCAIHKLLQGGGYRTRMLLQVHDELVFDMPNDEAEVVPLLIESAMIEAIPMSVPVRVELGTGETWLDAH